ncbi:MAG: tetratricopeptide repeat protein [Candidatus Aureabacteria bacterium]|nr:tetratricopeptide repeat protein [Candidatus Auribacterota bacterium]
MAETVLMSCLFSSDHKTGLFSSARIGLYLAFFFCCFMIFWHPFTYWVLGFLSEQPARKICFFSKALILDPAYSTAYKSRAWTRLRMNDLEGAGNDFKEAAQTDKADPLIWFGLGEIKLKKKDYNGAISDYSECIRTDPFVPYPLAFLQRSVAWKKLGRDSRALSDEIQYHYLVKDYFAALDVLQKYLTVYPKEIRPHELRGNIRMELKDYDGAIRDYDLVIRRFNRYSKIYFRRGLAKKFKKDYEGALEDFSSAISYAPRMADAFYERGLLYYRMGKKELSVSDLYAAGKCYLNLQDKKSVLSCADRIRKMDPLSAFPDELTAKTRELK